MCSHLHYDLTLTNSNLNVHPTASGRLCVFHGNSVNLSYVMSYKEPHRTVRVLHHLSEITA